MNFKIIIPVILIMALFLVGFGYYLGRSEYSYTRGTASFLVKLQNKYLDEEEKIIIQKADEISKWMDEHPRQPLPEVYQGFVDALPHGRRAVIDYLRRVGTDVGSLSKNTRKTK